MKGEDTAEDAPEEGLRSTRNKFPGVQSLTSYLTLTIAFLSLLGNPALLFAETPSVESPRTETAPRPSPELTPGLLDQFRLLREESVITGTWTFHPRKDSPVETDLITGRMIEQAGATNIGQRLQDVTAIQPGRTQAGIPVFSIQGLKFLHTLFLINGQELIGRFEDDIFTRDLLASPEIESIEIVKGATSVQYGSDAIAGVVNIRTRRATESFRTVGYSQYGRFNTVTTFAAPEFRVGKFGGYVSGGVSSSDGFDLTPDPRTDGSPDFSTKNVSGNFDYRASNRLLFGLYTRYSDDERKTQSNRTSLIPSTRLNKNDNQRLQTVLYTEWNPDAVSTFKMWGHYQQFQDNNRAFRLDNGTLLNSSGRIEELWEPQFQYTREVGQAHLLTVGGEHDIRRARGSGQGANTELTESAVWGQDEIEALPWLNFVLGGRYTTNSQAGGFFSPQTTMLVKQGNFRGRFSYTRGFRSPSLQEIGSNFVVPPGFGNVGNPNLKPEKSTSYTANVEYYFAKAKIGAGLFHHEVSDLITTIAGSCSFTEAAALGVPQSLCFKAANIGNIRSQGFELNASVAPFAWLLVETGYMYLDSKNLDLNSALPQKSTHAWKTQIYVQYAGWDFTARIRYYSSFGVADFNDNNIVSPSLTAPSNTQIDVRLARIFKNGLELYAGAENITGSRMLTRSFLVPAMGEQLWFVGVRIALK